VTVILVSFSAIDRQFYMSSPLDLVLLWYVCHWMPLKPYV